MTRSRLYRGALCAVLGACLHAGAWAAPWAMHAPPAGRVPFKGVATMDDVGKPGAMMYPAPGAAGLAAAILTHAVIANSVHENEKSEIEKAADKVLEPFEASLATFTQRELMLAAAPLSRRGEPRWLPASTKDERPEGWTVSSKPVFSMTQDRAALVLDNDVSITPLPGMPAYANRVRVVSAVQAHQDLVAFWGADDAKALKAESARLLAASLDIALDDAAAPRQAGAAGAQRTIRYPEGGKQLFERAEIIKEECDRLLVRNLRGWLMSVPRSKPADTACAAPAP